MGWRACERVGCFWYNREFGFGSQSSGIGRNTATGSWIRNNRIPPARHGVAESGIETLARLQTSDWFPGSRPRQFPENCRHTFFEDCSMKFRSRPFRPRRAGKILSGLVLILAVAGGCDRQVAPAPARSPEPAGSAESASISVECELDFSGRRETVRGTVTVASGATAFEVLVALAAAKGLEVESRGDGSTRFVTAIGGIQNEGAGKDNWVFRVDGKLGDRSSGIQVVQDGQKLVWSMGVYP